MDLQRFAFSTQAYSRHSLKKALKRIAKVGFKGAELPADKPHAWLDAFGPRDLARLVKQFEKLGLFVSNVQACAASGFWSDAPAEPLVEPSLVSPSRQLREWRIAYTKKALRTAKILGAPSVSVNSGKPLPGVPPEKALKLLEDSLARLVEDAEHLGQRFGVTLEPGLLIERPSELKPLLKKLGSSCLGANVDAGSLAVLGQDPCHALRELKGMIAHVSLADIRAQKNYARIPGEGEIDFRAIFRTLDQIGYSGPLTWNIASAIDQPDEACERSYKYTRTLLLERELVHGKPKPTTKKASLKHARQ